MAETLSDQHRSTRAPVARRHLALTLGIALLVLLGAFLRIWALGRQPLNSDEAVVGLMAHEILHGHFSAFYWGQSYGGGEPYVVALMFFLFGQSSFTLGLTPVLLDAISVVLLVFVGKRLFSLRVGVAAGLLFWVWPEVYIWQSTLEYGFRWVALICGLSVMLLSLRLLDGEMSHRRLSWAALGLFAGIGWWSTPEIVYFAVPCGLALGYRLVRKRIELSATEAVWALAMFILGAFPWLWANVRSRFLSLRPGVEPDPSFLSHEKALLLHALPILLGLQLPVPASITGPGRWLLSLSVGELLELLVLAAGVYWIAVLALSRRARVLVLFVVLFPFLYGLSPFTYYWADDRYAVFFAPAAALLLASGANEFASWLAARTSARAVLFVPTIVIFCLALALTGWALDNRSPWAPNHNSSSPEATWTDWTANPNGYVARLAGQLEASGQRELFAGYWVAYVLDFESNGAITATDVRYARYVPYLLRVRSSPNAGWLFVDPARRGAVGATYFQSALLDPGCAVKGDRCLDAREFRLYLAHNKIRYRTIAVADFTVIVPEHRLLPRHVLQYFGIVPPLAGT